MTSQKSLRNKVNLKDFERSFQGAWLFPLIALLVLFFSMVTPVISLIGKELGAQEKLSTISIFFGKNPFIVDYNLLTWGMLICGFMVAARQFNFLMSKKSVNVYLSMGISRTTLYVNRSASSLLMLAVAVLLPMTVLYGVNVSNFGTSAHLTQVYLYAMTTLFVSALAGFSLGAFSMMISGNIVEAVITGAGISAVPALVDIYFRDVIVERYLTGYVTKAAFSTGNWSPLLSPWTFVASLAANNGQSGYDYYSTRIIPETILSLTSSTEPLSKVAPENLAVNKNFWVPMLVWALVSIAFLILGGVFMKLRKAEHAKSFGNFAVSRAIGTITVVTLSCMFVSIAWDNSDKGLPKNPVILWIVLLLASAVAVFLVQLLWTRKFKKTLRSLRVFAIVFALFSIGFFTVSSDLFGTYNRTPKLEEVESMSMDVYCPETYYRIQPDATQELIEGKGEKDKDLAIRLFDLLKQEKPTEETGDRYLKEVTFAFRLKNGETMIRRFSIYNPKTYETYLKESISSAYFDRVLKAQLLEKNYDEKTGNATSYYKGFLRADFVSDNPYSTSDPSIHEFVERTGWYMVDRSGVVRLNEETAVPLQTDEAFYEALYKDLSQKTYESFFKNAEAPLAMLSRNIMGMGFEEALKDRELLSWRWPEAEQQQQLTNQEYTLAETGIYLYPEMKETLRYLQENGFEIAEGMQANIAEILYTDQNMSLEKAESLYAKKFEKKDRDYQNYFAFLLTEGGQDKFSRRNRVFFPSQICEIEEKRMTQYAWLTYIYETAGAPLQKAEAKDFQSIEAAAAVNFSLFNDDGRYAYIIYENGYMESIYIPASKCDVLK